MFARDVDFTEHIIHGVELSNITMAVLTVEAKVTYCVAIVPVLAPTPAKNFKD